MVIYHNPRCTKSRETLHLLKEKGYNPEIREYLKDIPSRSELECVIKMLDIDPIKLIRKTEKVFKENYKGLNLSSEEWIQAMIDHPKLIQRPILINGDKAAIGRPPTLVLDIL